MDYVKAFVGFIVVFLVVDIAWINLVIKNLYASEVGPLLQDTPNMTAAAVFYLFYAASIVYLIREAVALKSTSSALLTGAIVGALSYGTFTVTNYSVIEGWTFVLVISDILWGTFLTGLAAFASVATVRLWSR